MFNFLKEKLKSWLGSATGKKEKIAEIKVKPKKEKAEKAEKTKAEKPEKRKRTKTELAEERKVSKEIIEDIKKEYGEEIKPIPRPDEIIEELKKVKQPEVEEIKKEIEKKPGEEEAEKKSFWEKIGLSKKYKITEEDFSELFSELEMILLENNVALEVVDCLKNSLQKELTDKEIKKDELEKKIKQTLRNSISSLFIPGFSLIEKIKSKEGIFVIVFFGINGGGKTTTIAKIAHLLKKNNISCVLAASDTFRAASIEQLVKHGEKLGIKVIKQTYGSDPAAVAYDAIEYAKARKIKVVLIDTAGRMYTKTNLMHEMEKICRVTKPDLKIFVGEAITGNDATEQAKTFNEAVGIDCIILSKQDVDEKGGTSLSVSYVTKKPILFLGVGQNYSDLQEFNQEKLISALGL